MTITSFRAARAASTTQFRQVVVAGAPGAGKGTQCPRLAIALDVPHISTGELLREEVRRESALGLEVASTMARGGLLPDALVLALVGNRLTQDDALDGFVLDGFPRTSEQARALCNLLGADGLDLVVELTLPSDVILARLATRLVCGECGVPASPSPSGSGSASVGASGRGGRGPRGCELCGGRLERRSDDDAAAVHRRLAAYRCYTEPMLRWFERRNQLVRIDGARGTDEVTTSLLDITRAA
jgi:adenylate kinase